jgi:hypothetical protein
MSVEISLLPESSASLLSMSVCRTLPEKGYETFRVGRFGAANNERMEVIWHETVRGYFHIVDGCNAQKLAQNEFDNGGRRKVAAPLEGAHREKDALTAEINVVGQSGRSSMWHARDGSKIVAARLKPSRSNPKPSRSNPKPSRSDPKAFALHPNLRYCCASATTGSTRAARRAGARQARKAASASTALTLPRTTGSRAPTP